MLPSGKEALMGGNLRATEQMFFWPSFNYVENHVLHEQE